MKLGSLELTLNELQANMREKFRIKISLSTISKVLSQQDSIMAQNESNSYKIGPNKASMLENDLFDWIIANKNNPKLIITEGIISEKARSLNKQYKIENLFFSQGWIYDFLMRHCLKSYKCQGKEQLINEEDYKDELVF